MQDQVAGRRLIARRMGSAFEIGLGQVEAGQPGGDQADMPCLAGMGGASQGQFAVGQAEAVGGATLDQWQGL